jgi:hypothetical protein
MLDSYLKIADLKKKIKKKSLIFSVQDEARKPQLARPTPR